MSIHSSLSGLDLHEPYHYIQETDPGAVGAKLYWLKISTGIVKRRNDANAAWVTISPAPAVVLNFLGLTDAPHSYTGAANKVVSVKADESGLEFTSATGGGVGTGANIFTNAFASTPSSPSSGDIWFPSDTAVSKFTYNGTAWVPYTINNIQLALPNDTGSSWINQGIATVSTIAGMLRITTSASETTDSWKYRAYTAPTPPYTITYHIRPYIPGVNFSGIAFGWRESSSGNWIVAYFDYESGYGWGIGVNSAGGNAITANSITRFSSTVPNWIRLRDDGTNRATDFSLDGVNWINFYTQGRTVSLTGNQIIRGLNVRNSSGLIPVLDILSERIT